MKRIFVIILVLVLCSGCTQVPADSDDISIPASGVSIMERVQAPERVEKYYESPSGVSKITIDASIRVPEAYAFPVVEAIPQLYTDDELKQIMKYFVQGEWKDLEVEGDFGSDTEMRGIETEAGDIKTWRIWGSTVDTNLEAYKTFSYKHWELTRDGSVCYGPELEYSWGAYNQLWLFGAADPLVDGKAAGCTISLKEAQKMAEEAVDILWSDYEAEVVGQTWMSTMDDRQPYYSFNYTQMVAGIPVTWVGSPTPGSDQYSYIPRQSYVGVVVDDQGIRNFCAGTPWKIGDVIQEDTQLLTFDEIMDIFDTVGVLSQVSLENNNPDLKNQEVKIYSIVLGYMAVKTSDGYEYTPVWDFFGSKMLAGVGGYQEQGVIWGEEEQSQSILTINAIDGTIIDRSYGY